MKSVKSVVSGLDVDECAVVLTQPVELSADAPVWIGGKGAEVIHAEADKIWVSDLEGIQPEDDIVQSQSIGHLRDLFDAFHDQWKLRWCRHDGLAFSHWDQLIGFAQQVLMPRPIPDLKLDVDLLRAEAHRKKKAFKPLAWTV